MAETMGEFDEPCTLKHTYCSQLSLDEYEEQTFSATDKALNDLMLHLEHNPDEYARVLTRKKKQEAEEAGWISYAKVKLFSYFGDDSSYHSPSKQECDRELTKLKSNIMSVHKYSAQGRRVSARLAAKRRHRGTSIATDLSFTTSPATRKALPPAPPPPPIPPPLPPSQETSSNLLLTRRALGYHQMNLRDRTIEDKRSTNMASTDCHSDLLKQLSGQHVRKRLKRTDENRSPGGTPAGGWKKKRNDQSEIMSYFNAKLLEKFKNIRSPTPNSPSSFVESPE